MITLEQILSSQSDLLAGAQVKLIRHKDSREEYREAMKDRQGLLAYQKLQGRDIFKGCDYIISFVGLERRRSVLFGVFKVNSCRMVDGNYEYDLEPINEFDDFSDRLVIDWGNNTRGWHQWYHKQSKEVIELLPTDYIGTFPGLLDFVLEFDELRKLIKSPEANYEWQRHLSAVNGIYMILDTKTGQQYVGSAYGGQGIWQRWANYTFNGTGGNKELIALHESDQNYHRHFRFSVLQSLPSNITADEVIAIERRYKEKLGSRVHGLNHN